MAYLNAVFEVTIFFIPRIKQVAPIPHRIFSVICE